MAGRALVGEGREAEILEWGDGRVLRLLRDPNARARVEQEASAIAGASAAGIPVPEVYEIVEVDGRPGLVMERIDGTDLMTALSRRLWRMFAGARELGTLQARLHDTDAPDGLGELRARYEERIKRAPHLTPELRTFALDLLRDLPDGDRIAHGDFHPGNVMLAARGPVVIDWTNATRGEPMGDLARTVMILRCGALPPGMSALLRGVDRMGRSIFRRVWVRGYRAARPIDDEALTRWETVCAAARLAEEIEPEVLGILRLLEARLSSMGARA